MQLLEASLNYLLPDHISKKLKMKQNTCAILLSTASDQRHTTADSYLNWDSSNWLKTMGKGILLFKQKQNIDYMTCMQINVIAQKRIKYNP